MTLNDGYPYSRRVLLLPNILDHTLWDKYDLARHIEDHELELLSSQVLAEGIQRLHPNEVKDWHTCDAHVISVSFLAVEIPSRRSKEEEGTLCLSLIMPQQYQHIFKNAGCTT